MLQPREQSMQINVYSYLLNSESVIIYLRGDDGVMHIQSHSKACIQYFFFWKRSRFGIDAVDDMLAF